MSSKRRLRRRSCERKRRYDRLAAIKRAKSLRHRSASYHAYECAFCGGWHVGRRNRRRVRRAQTLAHENRI
jgi:hypothetical protein